MFDFAVPCSFALFSARRHGWLSLYNRSLLSSSAILNVMMASPSSANPNQARDNEDALFKELQGIFDKFLKFLVAIIGFKATDNGQHFFNTHPYLMVALVLAIMLYFSAWLIVTALHKLQIMRTFLPFMTCFVLTIGVIVSVWALIVFI